MKYTETSSPVLVGQTYAALRLGGASPLRACAELGVSSGRSIALEAHFRVRRPSLGGDAVRPRFARDKAHVKAVRAAGGYPAMPSCPGR